MHLINQKELFCQICLLLLTAYYEHLSKAYEIEHAFLANRFTKEIVVHLTVLPQTVPK